MISLEKGIEFEENKTFLEWKKPVDILIDMFGEKIEDKTDRTIYHWGKHSILNGLELYLIKIYWNFGKEKKNRKFDSIESWTIGDDEAKKGFDKISNHLIEQFGNPTSIDESNRPEMNWIWSINGIEIRLYLFEQHCYKLHFEIKKIS